MCPNIIVLVATRDVELHWNIHFLENNDGFLQEQNSAAAYGTDCPCYVGTFTVRPRPGLRTDEDANITY